MDGQPASQLQCVIIKGGERCTNIWGGYGITGVTLPIIRPEAVVFICVQCIDDMAFVAHKQEQLPTR